MNHSSEFEFSDDPGRIDLDVVWSYLSTEAYWGRWRTRDVVEIQVGAAWRVVGVYERHDGGMVGFARAISDGAAHAYLADLFILERARRRGLGEELVRVMIEDGPGANFRWSLHTDDAHRLYARFGFEPPGPEYMERPGRQPAQSEDT